MTWLAQQGDRAANPVLMQPCSRPKLLCGVNAFEWSHELEPAENGALDNDGRAASVWFIAHPIFSFPASYTPAMITIAQKVTGAVHRKVSGLSAFTLPAGRGMMLEARQ
jgi:hypothetical protein